MSVRQMIGEGQDMRRREVWLIETELNNLNEWNDGNDRPPKAKGQATDHSSLGMSSYVSLLFHLACKEIEHDVYEHLIRV